MLQYIDLGGSAGKAARILKPNTDGEKDPPSHPTYECLGENGPHFSWDHRKVSCSAVQ
jgi:hypothetical protein